MHQLTTRNGDFVGFIVSLKNFLTKFTNSLCAPLYAKTQVNRLLGIKSIN